MINKLKTFLFDSNKTRYEKLVRRRKNKIITKNLIRDFLLIVLGIFSASFGFKGFLLTNRLIDGGATGISLLLTSTTGLPLYLYIILVNVPFIILGFKVLGRDFVFRTILAILGLALVLAFVEFPNVTDEKILVPIFGGFFLGTGVGLAIRGGAVLDGTEILAIYLSKKIGFTIGDIVVIINVMIFSVAAYLLGIEVALYSMLTYLAASKSIDYVVEGLEEYIGVTIISNRNPEIKTMIADIMGRGYTVYQGKKGFGKRGVNNDVEIIYTVITRLEMSKLNSEIEKITSDAFVVMSGVKDTRGGMIKERRLK
ncbi:MULTISPECIES: YitT family protein [Amniculibacterium]|uniref:YitT family protein n=1 Tax=Amniculibacterium TaxID=2715289 RepID=UPI000F597D8C|nr:MULTISPECIES: YitT family protein [Amniculibacterium]